MNGHKWHEFLSRVLARAEHVCVALAAVHVAAVTHHLTEIVVNATLAGVIGVAVVLEVAATLRNGD